MEPACKNCVHWVAYDQPIATAARGECLCESLLKTVRTHDTVIRSFQVVTPFDWHCKGFLEAPTPQEDCGQPRGG